ncbi:PREDICTED: putative nuclease HARBI1 [Rhagoletis zephyria]|uniref:putative nuclease HARBI1 n=1 Tax=Rhagoletis zephyria TaxID=28612 RepID=UPI0008113D18|nr:PREDICTED: putative nuclease HARBI1 [Rhagoletis zephyria]
MRFLAEGGFQRSIGKDLHIALHRSTISKVLKEMLNILERTQCPKWIKLRMSFDEIRQSKLYFSNNFNIPGVIGCIDGTHVKLLKPNDNDHLYYNRKGCFSVNAMIICDFRMIIRAVDACHPGSSHDSFIFNQSNAKHYLESKYEAGDHSSWLLGDSGYGLEPFLLTPYRDPSAGTSEHVFNLQHAKARNIIERVIGVLKSRFKCLQQILPYTPQKVVQIVNICSTLHNKCRYHNIDDVLVNCTEDITDDEPAEQNSRFLTSAAHIRDEISLDDLCGLHLDPNGLVLLYYTYNQGP